MRAALRAALRDLRLDIRDDFDDTATGIVDTSHAYHIEIRRSASRVAKTFAANLTQNPPPDMARLKPLGDAILLSFNPERSASDMAREIAEAIAGFRAREAAPDARRGDRSMGA